MNVKINAVTELLSENLSIEERGVLITILLTRDPDSKIALAKAKAKLSFRKYRDTLISLQDKGFIEWSGYKKAKISIKEAEDNPKVVEVLSFLNNLYGTRYKTTSKSATENLRRRLKEYSVEDCKLVISNRYKEWKDDPLMYKYLTPYTIFRPSKFEKYLQEAKKTDIGKEITEEQELNIKKGDVLTLKKVMKMSDKETYSVKIFSLNANRNRVGTGRQVKMTGKGLKIALKILESSQKRDSEYIYDR